MKISKRQWQYIAGFGLLALTITMLGGLGAVTDKAGEVDWKFWDREVDLGGDGVTYATNWQISFRDEIDPSTAVTPTQCRVRMPDGTIEYAQTLAAGYARFEGVEVREGWELEVEGDSSTNYYNRVQTFSVPNIAPHDADDYPIVYTMQLWGMDPSSDAGVVTLMEGVNLLFNGTGTEDSLTVDAGTEYGLKIDFDWNAATNEMFGCEEYTQLDEDLYTYVPVIKIVTSAGCEIDDVMQGSVKLEKLHNAGVGTSVVAIYQIIPMEEDDGITADEIYTITFNFTPDDASSDTIDVTFHDETRLDRADDGYTSQSAVETISQITTA